MSSPVGYPQRNAYPMFSSTSKGDTPVGVDGGLKYPLMATTTSLGWVEDLSAGLVIAPESAQIALIGDSRMEAVWYRWSIAVSSPSGIPTNGLYINFQGAQAAATLGGTGAFEYDATTDRYRWTAPGDSAGPWVAADVGAMLLPSGSANAGLFVTVWRKPAASAAQSVGLAATRVNHNSGAFLNRHALVPYILSAYPDAPVARLGAGGSRLGDGAFMLPWYAREAGGAGFDVFWYGTNNINSMTGLAGMISSAQQILDARRALGRRIVVIGEHARWGAAVGTPLSEAQQADLRAYNAWLKSWCAERRGVTRYIDALQLTADPGYTDCRPVTGISGRYDMLYDIVHPKNGASLAIGPRVVDALRSLGLERTRTPLRKGDTGAMTFGDIGLMIATGGAAGANVTTTNGLPTGITASTSAASVVATYDMVPSTIAPPMGAVSWTYTATDSGTAYARCFSSTTVLATAGWAVGDRVKFRAIVSIERCDEADAFMVKYSFAGALGSSIGVELTPPSVPGEWWLESPEVVIPSGTTGITFEVRVTPKGTGVVKGSARVENLIGVKVG